jgi:uncharacterized protein with HEPN domain
VTDGRLLDYLEHMGEATKLAIEFLQVMSKDEFLEDKRTQQAVIFNLIVLGEAATKILNDYPEFARRHDSVPWTSMKGMRNRIAHGYFDIDLEIVWETVQRSLPALRKSLEEIQTGSH